MKRILFLIAAITASVFASERVHISIPKGEYEINFDNTYVLPVHMDIETAIILPPGYNYTAGMPGSVDYISVSTIENTVYISKTVDHKFQTNLTLHVLTPEGIKGKLTFEIIADLSKPKVYSVTFTQPNSSDLNQAIEQIKAKYTEQLSAKLYEQEKKLNLSILERTFLNSVPVFFNADRGDITEDYKGATVWMDGVINSDAGAFVYIRSDVKDDECKVVQLKSVKLKKDYNGTAELVGNYTVGKHIMYVYKIPKLPLLKKSKMVFNIQIWSKMFKLTAKAS